MKAIIQKRGRSEFIQHSCNIIISKIKILDLSFRTEPKSRENNLGSDLSSSKLVFQNETKMKEKVLNSTANPTARQNTKNNKKDNKIRHDASNNKKLTDFFPIRRSVRKTNKEVQQELLRSYEKAIIEKREEGLEVN